MSGLGTYHVISGPMIGLKKTASDASCIMVMDIQNFKQVFPSEIEENIEIVFLFLIKAYPIDFTIIIAFLI